MSSIVLSGHVYLPSFGLIALLLLGIHTGISILCSAIAWGITRSGKAQLRFPPVFLYGFGGGILGGFAAFILSVNSGRDEHLLPAIICYFAALLAGIGIGLHNSKERGRRIKIPAIKMELIIQSIDSIQETAAGFLRHFPDKRIFAFHGELGAGKTTFIKALCSALGVKEPMSSPSFSLVNEYRDANDQPLYHFDLYRLESPAEAFEIGLEEYLYSGNYCFVEWPERAGELLPEETVQVFISEDHGKRMIAVKE